MGIYFNEFLNNFEKTPKTVDNGFLINGVAQIYQSAKPTVRPDGSALVSGDIWYNTSTSVVGSWNGTYWLQSTLQNFIVSTTPGTYGNFSVTLPQFSIPLSTGIAGVFVRDFTISGRLSSANDVSNYHSVSIYSHNGGGLTLIGSVNTIGLVNIFKKSLAINTAYLFPANGTSTSIVYFQTTASVVGTPGNIGIPSAQISYNQILA
jgi:hypothetical protein